MFKTLLIRLLPPAIHGITLLPFRLRSALGWIAGTLFSIFPSREKRIAELQLSRVLGTVPTSTTRKMFASLGQTALESVDLSTVLESPDKFIEFPSPERITEWQERGPIVGLTGHVGNWDLLAACMVRRGLKLTVVGKEMRNPEIQELLEQIRLNHGIKTIWRGDTQALREIVDALKRGEAVAALIDQDTRVTSVFVDFFGVPVKTPASLVALGKRHRCTFVSAFMVRTGFFRFKIEMKELDSTASVEAILRQYNQELERILRAHPHQWVWFHKRWRTTEKGETLSSSEYIRWLTGRM